MAASVRPDLHPFKMHSKVSQREEAHFQTEPALPGQMCLLEGHLASKSRFDRETDPFIDTIEYKPLELEIHHPPNLVGNPDL